VDAIHQLQFMEVDQEAYGDVEQFHVAEQLSLELILQKETKKTKKEPKPSSSPLGLTANVIC